jgi:hypothetical protein
VPSSYARVTQVIEPARFRSLPGLIAAFAIPAFTLLAGGVASFICAYAQSEWKVPNAATGITTPLASRT